MKLNTPKAPGCHPLADFANEMKATYKGKEEEKKASYLLKYSFAPDKTFRFALSMHKSIRKTYMKLNGAVYTVLSIYI